MRFMSSTFRSNMSKHFEVWHQPGGGFGSRWKLRCNIQLHPGDGVLLPARLSWGSYEQAATLYTLRGEGTVRIAPTCAPLYGYFLSRCDAIFARR